MNVLEIDNLVSITTDPILLSKLNRLKKLKKRTESMSFNPELFDLDCINKKVKKTAGNAMGLFKYMSSDKKLRSNFGPLMSVSGRGH